MLRGTAHAQTPARRRGTGRAGDRRRDAGFVVFLLLIILVVGSVAVFLNGLNTASASMKLRRDDVTTAALKQAKEGLIAWAATRAADGPGHLPCPDRKEIDQPLAGYQESTCVGAPARIGRLPFRTLGLPDLRDASGERLWYALSAGFRDGAGVPVNSDTLGTLTVEGASVANGVVAIIFAPGAIVGAQSRAVADSDDPTKYLESPNPYLADTFLASSGCEASACPLPFGGGAAVPSQHNDQFIVITHEDLFRVVEAVVQRRIELEIAPQLTKPADSSGYFEKWGLALYGDNRRGFFPFAAPYNDPLATPNDPSRPADDFLGAYGQINGLLPVTRDVAGTRVRWNAPPSVGDLDPPTLSVLAGGGSVTPFDPFANCNTGAGYPVCSFDYTCTAPTCASLRVRFQARLKNVAESFVTNPGDFIDPNLWQVDGAALSALPGAYAAVLDKSLIQAADGGLRVTLEFTLPQTTVPPTRTVAVAFPATAPTFSTFVTPTNWFIANGWHRQAYYAISDGFRLRPDLGTRVIDPSNAAYATSPPCEPEPTLPACIRVDNGPAKVRAIIVLAGRHLAGGARGYAVGNYFEMKNADVPSTTGAPVNQVFERRLRAGDFNDRVVVVSPEPPGP